MGEHHRNPNAIAKAALPAGAGQIRVELGVVHRLKQKFIVLPAEQMRVVDGRQEIFGHLGGGETGWAPVPEGREALAEGTQVGIEAMDTVVGLVAISITGVTGIDGRPVGRQRWLTELHREDAQAFMTGLQPPQPPVVAS